MNYKDEYRDYIWDTPVQPVCPMLYTLPYIMYEDDLGDDMDDDLSRQPPYSVARILHLYETKSPQSFTQLERYGIPRFVIRRIFRSVIGYILRNVNVAEPLPQPVSQYAATLLNRLLSSRPMYQNILTYFNVPLNTARGALLNLVVFTLNNLTTLGGGAAAANRMEDTIASSPDVFKHLANYRINEDQARALAASVARSVLSSPPIRGTLKQRCQQITDTIIRDTDIFRSLVLEGVPAESARETIYSAVAAAIYEV